MVFKRKQWVSALQAGMEREGGSTENNSVNITQPEARAVGLIWAFGNRGGEGGTHSFGMSLFK